jgi:hypothetical protein
MVHHQSWSLQLRLTVASPQVLMEALTWVLLVGNHHLIRVCHHQILVKVTSIPNHSTTLHRQTSTIRTMVCEDQIAQNQIITILVNQDTCGHRLCSSTSMSCYPPLTDFICTFIRVIQTESVASMSERQYPSLVHWVSILYGGSVVAEMKWLCRTFIVVQDHQIALCFKRMRVNEILGRCGNRTRLRKSSMSALSTPHYSS